MTDRDRLPACVGKMHNHTGPCPPLDSIPPDDDLAYEAGREDGLAEALDEKRLARALIPVLQPVMDDLGIPNERGEWSDAVAAAIAKAYREDTEREIPITTAQLDWMDQHGGK